MRGKFTLLGALLSGAALAGPAQPETPLREAPITRILVSSWQRASTLTLPSKPRLGDIFRPTPTPPLVQALSPFPYWNVVDGALETSWGSGRPFSEWDDWIQLYFDESILLSRLSVATGLQSGPGVPASAARANFANNGRPMDVRFEFSDGSFFDVVFDDTLGFQHKDFPPVRTRWVRLRVRSIYPSVSNQPGVTDDFGISEIRAYRVEERPTVTFTVQRR